MNYVVCLKYGNKYSAEYVNKLYSMVERHLTTPHEFICFTEDPTDIDARIKIKPLELIPGIEGWWYKLMFFNPNLGLEGTILFLDLDLIIFNNIDYLFMYKPNAFCILRHFNRRDTLRPVSKDFTDYLSRRNEDSCLKFNSSVFRLQTGQHSRVYTDFVKDSKNIIDRFDGDQEWMNHVIRQNYNYWPYEWIRSYKLEMKGRSIIKPETSVAVFHGKPKPSDYVDNWCRYNWY